jgi:hypothetical protein
MPRPTILRVKVRRETRPAFTAAMSPRSSGSFIETPLPGLPVMTFSLRAKRHFGPRSYASAPFATFAFAVVKMLMPNSGHLCPSSFIKVPSSTTLLAKQARSSWLLGSIHSSGRCVSNHLFRSGRTRPQSRRGSIVAIVSRVGPGVRRLAGGGRWIRTLGPPCDGRRFRTAGASADRGFQAGRHGGDVAARHQGDWAGPSSRIPVKDS